MRHLLGRNPPPYCLSNSAKSAVKCCKGKWCLNSLVKKKESLQNLETEPHINKFPDIVGVFMALAHAKFYLSISGIVRLTDDCIGPRKFAFY